MNRRTRASHRASPPSRSEPYLKYLKPGALAQIRDSRIIARSHRIDAMSRQIRSPSSSSLSPPASPPSTPGQPPFAAMEGFPCFSVRVYGYGPRCPQRKKLVAAKSVLFPTSSPVLVDASDPIIDVFGGGDIAAH